MLSRKTRHKQRKNEWPHDYEEAIKDYYGETGTQQIRIDLPFPMVLSWEPEVTIQSFKCHMAVADSLLKIFNEIASVYSLTEIQELGLNQFGGCLNVRDQRGKENKNKPSRHSWGIAIDICPDGNGLHTPFAESKFSDAKYIPLFNAFIRQGWLCAGLEWGYDSMHFQATKNEQQLLYLTDPRFRHAPHVP